MLDAKEAVIWVNDANRQILVKPHSWGAPDHHGYNQGPWGDPIGAAYSQWSDMNNDQRVRLMLETVIDLAMQGFALKEVLIAFANVKEFRALGDQSYPMCRALTSALVGKSLEPNTMSFEELLVAYAPDGEADQ